MASISISSTDDGHMRATVLVPVELRQWRCKDGTTVPATLVAYDADPQIAQARAIDALVRLVFNLQAPAQGIDLEEENGRLRKTIEDGVAQGAKMQVEIRKLQTHLVEATATIAKLDKDRAEEINRWRTRAIAAETRLKDRPAGKRRRT
jgi:hypothetical protein